MKLKMSKEVDLGKEPIGHLLFVLAVPSIISQLVNALYNMVDRMYIGHIPDTGAMALTGVGVCMPLIMIITAFAALVGNGGAPRATIFMGKNKKDDAEDPCQRFYDADTLIHYSDGSFADLEPGFPARFWSKCKHD